MCLLGMAEIGGLSLQVYVGGVAKVDIQPMNIGQRQIDKATRYHQKMPWGRPLTGPHDECGTVTPSYCGVPVLPGKLKKSNVCS